jgi:hypothetical protein
MPQTQKLVYVYQTHDPRKNADLTKWYYIVQFAGKGEQHRENQLRFQAFKRELTGEKYKDTPVGEGRMATGNDALEAILRSEELRDKKQKIELHLKGIEYLPKL